MTYIGLVLIVWGLCQLAKEDWFVRQMLQDAEVAAELQRLYEEAMFNLFMELHQQAQEQIFTLLSGR